MHCTLANIASGLIGIGLGTILGGFIVGCKNAALRAALASRDASIDRLTPWAEKGRKRQAALDKAKGR